MRYQDRRELELRRKIDISQVDCSAVEERDLAFAGFNTERSWLVKPFLERVREGLLLFDGAVGTMLQSWGLPVGEAPERWVFEKPD